MLLCYNVNWNLGCVRNISAYFIINQIIGMNARAMAANSVLPQPKPRSEYNLRPANGNRAPPTLLRTVLAAIALAAYAV